jgi:hypothetical protein
VTYWLLALVVTATTFAAVVALLSAAVVAATPWILARSARYAPASRAALLLAARLLPSVAAVTAAFVIALPTFLWYEEANSGEHIGPTLAITSIAGAWFLLRGARTAWRAWRDTAAVVRGWERGSRPAPELGAAMPASAVTGTAAVVAVSGCVRPRLFVSQVVLDVCTPREVAAIVAHEAAHTDAFDNLKRVAICACPDAADPHGALEAAWSAAAEHAADAKVVAVRPDLALDLAQALIRVARLTTGPQAPLASALVEADGLASRVRRLVDPPLAEAAIAPRRWFVVALLAAAALAASAVAAAPDVHELVELAVQVLP